MWDLRRAAIDKVNRGPGEEELAMSQSKSDPSSSTSRVKLLRTCPRFSVRQRWEHAILLLSIATLLLTGLPQKYRTAVWSQTIISSLDRLATIQLIHRVAALVLTGLVLYHLGKAIFLMAPSEITLRMVSFTPT